MKAENKDRIKCVQSKKERSVKEKDRNPRSKPCKKENNERDSSINKYDSASNNSDTISNDIVSGCNPWDSGSNNSDNASNSINIEYGCLDRTRRRSPRKKRLHRNRRDAEERKDDGDELEGSKHRRHEEEINNNKANNNTGHCSRMLKRGHRSACYEGREFCKRRVRYKSDDYDSDGCECIGHHNTCSPHNISIEDYHSSRRNHSPRTDNHSPYSCHSPHTHYSPDKHHSNRKHHSSHRHQSPHSRDSPDTLYIPHRHVLLNERHSPHKLHSPRRHSSPRKHHSSRHHSPSRQRSHRHHNHDARFHEVRSPDRLDSVAVRCCQNLTRFTASPINIDPCQHYDDDQDDDGRAAYQLHATPGPSIAYKENSDPYRESGRRANGRRIDAVDYATPKKFVRFTIDENAAGENEVKSDCSEDTSELSLKRLIGRLTSRLRDKKRDRRSLTGKPSQCPCTSKESAGFIDNAREEERHQPTPPEYADDFRYKSRERHPEHRTFLHPDYGTTKRPICRPSIDKNCIHSCHRDERGPLAKNDIELFECHGVYSYPDTSYPPKQSSNSWTASSSDGRRCLPRNPMSECDSLSRPCLQYVDRVEMTPSQYPYMTGGDCSVPNALFTNNSADLNRKRDYDGGLQTHVTQHRTNLPSERNLNPDAGGCFSSFQTAIDRWTSSKQRPAYESDCKSPSSRYQPLNRECTSPQLRYKHLDYCDRPVHRTYEKSAGECKVPIHCLSQGMHSSSFLRQPKADYRGNDKRGLNTDYRFNSDPKLSLCYTDFSQRDKPTDHYRNAPRTDMPLYDYYNCSRNNKEEGVAQSEENGGIVKGKGEGDKQSRLILQCAEDIDDELHKSDGNSQTVLPANEIKGKGDFQNHTTKDDNNNKENTSADIQKQESIHR